MSTPDHGYSGTPLYRKLGLKPGMRCQPIRPPANYSDLVAEADGVRFTKRARKADVVHLFCRTRRDLDQCIEDALDRVVEGGMLWVSWFKKSSPSIVDLTEDQLREVLLPRDWVDIKVCSVDQDWSALKFVRRKSSH